MENWKLSGDRSKGFGVLPGRILEVHIMGLPMVASATHPVTLQGCHERSIVNGDAVRAVSGEISLERVYILAMSICPLRRLSARLTRETFVGVWEALLAEGRGQTDPFMSLRMDANGLKTCFTSAAGPGYQTARHAHVIGSDRKVFYYPIEAHHRIHLLFRQGGKKTD